MNIDEQLRRHDPARNVPNHLGRSPRAVATLARVTATEPGMGPSAVSMRPARNKQAARFALAGVAALVGVVLAPILGTSEAAVADGDATPRPVTMQEATQYAQECAEWTHISGGGTRGDVEPTVVEARGTWVMTYLASADGEAQCLRSTEPSPDFVDGENLSLSGPPMPTPTADGLATAGVEETSVISRKHFLVAGKAGSQVTGVVFEAQGVRVRATLSNGSFTAWWPQRKSASLVGRLIDNSGFNGSANPKVTITLSNGKTITKHIKDYAVNQ